jgi:hypothetical protein
MMLAVTLTSTGAKTRYQYDAELAVGSRGS